MIRENPPFCFFFKFTKISTGKTENPEVLESNSKGFQVAPQVTPLWESQGVDHLTSLEREGARLPFGSCGHR